MKIIFAGTPDFAVPCLQTLLDSTHQVVGVYSQPDRPAGRGRKLAASPVKQLARQNDIPVFQPVSLKTADAQKELATLEPDLMVVVAYGLILPQTVIDIPRLGCVNVHASLLPRWRGAAPIQRAIEAGDEETGVTLMQMDAGLDTGAMLLERRCQIAKDETGGSLHDRLADLGATLLAAGIEIIAQGKAQATPQPDEGVSYAHKLSKAEARLDWLKPATDNARLVRAFNPWPVAHSVLAGDHIRLWHAEALPETSTARPGTIINASSSGIDVACGQHCLRILDLQWPGGRPMTAAQAITGRNLVGQQFS